MARTIKVTAEQVEKQPPFIAEFCEPRLMVLERRIFHGQQLETRKYVSILRVFSGTFADQESLEAILHVYGVMRATFDDEGHGLYIMMALPVNKPQYKAFEGAVGALQGYLDRMYPFWDLLKRQYGLSIFDNS